jgi:hypothetical protein
MVKASMVLGSNKGIQPGASVGASSREMISADETSSFSRGRSRRVKENPGRLIEVYIASEAIVEVSHNFYCLDLNDTEHSGDETRKVRTIYRPAPTLTTLIPRSFKALNVSPAIAASSISLRPPRLFTKRTTSSDPSFLKDKKERSSSVVLVM